MNYKKIISLIVLVLADAITITISYLIAYFIRKPVLSLFFSEIIESLPFQVFISRFYIVFVFILIVGYEGLYHKRYEFWEEMRLIWKSNLVATALIMIILYMTQSFIVSRAIVILAFMLNLFLLPIQRKITKSILYKTKIWQKNILVIGTEKIKEKIIHRFRKQSNLGYQVVAYLDGQTLINHQEKLSDILVNNKINGIIVDAEVMTENHLKEVYEEAEGKVEDFFVIPALSQLQTSGVEIEQLEDILFMKYHYNLLRTESRISKRIFDLLIAFLMIIICIPLFIIISILIKLTSSGPIFHTQQRVGKDNKLFRCYKFRTMYLNAQQRLEKLFEQNPHAKVEWEKYLKITNDPRVTKIGKFLRRSSLDELPQLFNVIKGEMSLVGPRPYLPNEVENKREKISLITKVRPGITGLWQVSGRSQLTFEERMRLDEYYVKNWTIWLDAVIMIKTIKVLFNSQGAY